MLPHEQVSTYFIAILYADIILESITGCFLVW